MMTLTRSWKTVDRVVFALFAVGIMASAGPAAAQTPSDRPVTFSKDVAPILQKHCQQCHRPDSIAPMALLTYEQARPYARAIKQRTQLVYVRGARGAMPPWLYERNIGIQNIQEDWSLSDEEIATLARWADSGAAEGNRADLPPSLTFADNDRWLRGKPDLIVSSPPFFVPGVRADWWGDVGETAPVEALTEDRYAMSAEYKETSELTKSSGPLKRTSSEDTYPGQGKTSIWTVHHGGAHFKRPGGDGEVSSIPNHEVGHNGHIFSAEAGKLVPAKAIVAFTGFHVHSPGIPDAGRDVVLNVGLKLFPRGYTPKFKEVHIQVPTSELFINSESANQRYDSYFIAPQPLLLGNFEPHMHAAGMRMCIEAVYEMSVETLSCSGYDHNWVRNYRYEENYQPLLPKGTILHLISWFDGTAKNANLVDARNSGLWGRRSVENMLGVNDYGYYLTDEQYEQEVAKRREFLTRTNSWDKNIGCHDCWKTPGTKVVERFKAID